MHPDRPTAEDSADTTRPAAPRDLPRQLGPYRLVRLAGSGAMGQVYQAHDLDLDRWVAIKRLHTPAGEGLDPHAAARLLNEARAAARLSHPHVAQVYRIGEDEGRPYIAMEWLDGVDLSSWVRSQGPLHWQDAVALVADAASALEAAHNAGLVHRDVKPSNLMRLHDGTVKVVDFGLARSMLVPSELTASGAIVGTPAYMSPEQCVGEPATALSDLYALGCTLHFLLTGSAPFVAGDALRVLDQHVRHPFPDLRRRVPGLPTALAGLVEHATAKAPADRGPGAGAWRAGLLRLLADRPSAAAASTLVAGPAFDRTVPMPRPAAEPEPAVPERNAFVGRARELRELAERLQTGTRLLTLVGTGGIGKTRLVGRHARLSRGDWPGGTHLCDLSEATTPGGLYFAVAQALGVALGNDDPVARIGHAIAGRGRCLVILDNFEQLVGYAAATVGAWVDRCPEAQFLVASRERLRLDAETVYELQPLSLEDEAVALFAARAAAQRGRFVVDDGNRATVLSLVRLLDGLPLAIELAAARVGVLSPAQIVERLRDRFALLGGARGVPARQATLRAAIDWSWQLLSPAEQAALAQCAVFEGAFTVERAEAVLDLSPWPDAPPALDVVQALVDKSLLRAWVPADAGPSLVDVPQLGMFLGVREYAAVRLAEHGPAARAEAEHRHGRAYAQACGDAVLALLPRAAGQARRQALMLELDNLVAACRRAIGRADADTALATCRGVRELLVRRGPFGLAVELARDVAALPMPDDGPRAQAAALLSSALRQVGHNEQAAEWLDRALALATGPECERQAARWAAARGNLERELGRPTAADRWLMQALASGQAQGDPLLQIDSLMGLAQLDTDQGETGRARQRLEQALALARAAGEPGIEALLQMPLGVLLAEQGLLDEGRQHFEAALRRAREFDDRRFEGELLTNLGCLAQDQGRLGDAADCFGRALTVHRELGDRRWEGFVLGDLGRLQMLRGDLDGARRELEASLLIMREIGNRRIEGSELRSLGDLHRQAGRAAEARQAYAEAEQALRPIGDRYYLAFVVCGQAELAFDAGQVDQGRHRLAEAQALADQLGANTASELGRRLTALQART
jgi:predicted ATPase